MKNYRKYVRKKKSRSNFKLYNEKKKFFENVAKRESSRRNSDRPNKILKTLYNKRNLIGILKSDEAASHLGINLEGEGDNFLKQSGKRKEWNLLSRRGFATRCNIYREKFQYRDELYLPVHESRRR